METRYEGQPKVGGALISHGYIHKVVVGRNISKPASTSWDHRIIEDAMHCDANKLREFQASKV